MSTFTRRDVFAAAAGAAALAAVPRYTPVAWNPAI